MTDAKSFESFVTSGQTQFGYYQVRITQKITHYLNNSKSWHHSDGNVGLFFI